MALTHQWIEKSNQILDGAYAQIEMKRRSSMLKKANANKNVEQKKEQLKNTIQKLELCKKLKDCQMKLQKSEEENGQLKLDLRDLEKNIGKQFFWERVTESEYNKNSQYGIVYYPDLNFNSHNYL